MPTPNNKAWAFMALAFLHSRKTANIFTGRLFIFALCIAVIYGCASAPPAKQQNTLDQLHHYANVELTHVPFFAQTSYQCGPAALATILSAENIKSDTQTLSNEIYLPKKQGALQPLLIASARKRGVIPYVQQGQGLKNLLEEVYEGKPVLILQNLGLSKTPSWHYAVVVGFNNKTQEFILRSGKNKRQLRSAKFLEYTWRASNYWSLTLYKPQQVPVNPQEANWLNAIAGLEELGKSTPTLLKASHIAYTTAAKALPNSFMAYMGKGNTAYQLQQYANAAKAYRHAANLTKHPHAAHHNLAWALIKQGHIQSAKVAAQQAAQDPRYTSALIHINNTSTPK